MLTKASHARRTAAAVGASLILAALGGALAPQARAEFLADPVIFNSSEPFGPPYPAFNVFDDSPADYASQTHGTATFMDFDFGVPTTIDALDIINRPGTTDAVTFFDLIFSDDPLFGDVGDTKVTVTQDYTSVTEQGMYLGRLVQFAPQTARYVRWDVTGVLGGFDNNGAAEMRFRSAGEGNVRLAPDAVNVYVAASSANPIFFDRSNATDGELGYAAGGDYGTTAAAGAGTFVNFDLGSAQAITGVEMVQRLFAEDRAASFDLHFSNDPNFNTIIATRSYTSSSMFVSDTFAPVSARYVQFDVTAAGIGEMGMQELSFLTADPEPSLPGDFDNDGDVDGGDFLAWQRGGSPNSLGSADLADWRANYGAGSFTAASTLIEKGASPVAVPEPQTVVLYLAGVAATIPRRRRAAAHCRPLSMNSERRVSIPFVEESARSRTSVIEAEHN